MSNAEKMVMVPRELVERIVRAGCWPDDEKDIRQILDQPAQQGQGEPVAWRFVEPGDEHNGFQQRVRVTIDKPSATRARLGCEPLFAHADQDEAEWSAVQQRLGDQNKTLRAQLVEAREDRNKIGDLYDEAERKLAEAHALRSFANDMISAAYEGGSFDGGDIQDMAVKHGLLRIESRAEECGEACACREYGFPAECYRKTPMLSASAEPSAPNDCAICRGLGNQCMECEEREFREWADRHFAAADYRKTDTGVFIQDWMRHAYAAWCARGALASKQ